MQRGTPTGQGSKNQAVEGVPREYGSHGDMWGTRGPHCTPKLHMAEDCSLSLSLSHTLSLSLSWKGTSPFERHHSGSRRALHWSTPSRAACWNSWDAV